MNQTQALIHFVFIDESGNLSSAHDRFFAIAAIVTPRPHTLKEAVRKIRAWLQRRGKRYQTLGEIKFYNAGDHTRVKFLETLAQAHDIEIYLLVVEKDLAGIEDTPENYATAIWVLLQDVLNRHPNTAIVLDKHFTKERDKQEVNARLEQKVGRALRIEHVDSQQDARVQPADFVAGAALAKYYREESRFLEIVAAKIVVERLMGWREIEKMVKSQSADLFRQRRKSEPL